jgi:hypothetical protein
MKIRIIIGSRVSVAVFLALIAFLAPAAHAVEGGLARPISGGQINPFAGVVPPEPGFALGLGELYYDGSIGGTRRMLL